MLIYTFIPNKETPTLLYHFVVYFDINLLPPHGVRLYNQNGYEIQLDTSDLELTDELRMAIDEGIAELDRGEGISNENVLNEFQAKYPNLNFRK